MSEGTPGKTAYIQRDPVVIFADLDGTLIFSASKMRPGDIVCEYKDGAPITCISPRQAELLPGLAIIPVTTRSTEQYSRIRIPGFHAEYALTDNGGTLLINGIPDPEWSAASMRLVRECSDGLSTCREILERDPHRSFEIRMVDGMFLFTKSDDPAATLSALEQAAAEGIRCFSTGAKIYALPAGLSKGNAAQRLAARVSPGCRIICAGDSLMDIPLLNIADTALFPDDIPQETVAARNRMTAPRERFPEFVTEQLTKMKD